MVPDECEFGYWGLSEKAPGLLEINFLAPKESHLKFDRNCRLALKIVYVCVAASGCFIQGFSRNSVAAFLLSLLLIPFASYLRRGGHRDRHFIPFIITVDKRTIEMTDPRIGHAAVRTCSTADIKAIYLDVRTGDHAPPPAIVILFRSGVSVYLPPYGLDAARVLDPLRTYLPISVLFGRPFD